MKLAKINLYQFFWELEIFGNTIRYEGTSEEKALSIVIFLKEKEIDGGVIKGNQIIFETTEGIFELGQWLTEQLNVPFVDDKKNFEEQVEKMKWTIEYYGYRPGKDEYSVESLLTIGNGFMGLRGTVPEMEITDNHYPATYIAGLYDTEPSDVDKHTVYNEDFVNAPNLQKIYLIVDEEKVEFKEKQIESLRRSIDFRTGIFTSEATVILESGKKIAVNVKKVVNMKEVSQYSLSYSFKPLNFSGDITLVSEADGNVRNYNVERYRSLEQYHLDAITADYKKNKALLVVKTKQSNITITQFSELFSETIGLTQINNSRFSNGIRQEIVFNVCENSWTTIEKTVKVILNREKESVALIDLNDMSLSGFASNELDSAKEWSKLWAKAALSVEGDLMSQKLLNLHTYHMITSASPNGNKNLDVSISARGLHGEAYRGHIFWDELFILPFYILHFPDTAKNILMYRYRRLDAAKKYALENGYSGAMFPWQSGLEGTEQSQAIHLNPLNGEWIEDHSRLQRHVSLAIAYNIFLYFKNTNDIDFMEKFGIEMILEIARFWESASVWDDEINRFSISGVMGPDEFHESYPQSKKAGLKNNAYSNIMAVWLFEQVQELEKKFSVIFKDKLQKTEISGESLIRMKKIRHQLALDIDTNGVIAQFDGYFNLKDLDWDYYREKYGNIYRMDRILNAEGLSVDDYQVAKQADTLMAFYNLPKRQIDVILKELNYTLPETYLDTNLSYYLKRTSHGSTLSRVVHAHLASIVGEEDLAWNLFQQALYSDYRDIQGGTTAEGIHTGVMAATLYIPISTFSGLDIRQEIISFAPKLPEKWDAFSYKVTLRGNFFEVNVLKNRLVIKTDKDMVVKVFDQLIELRANQENVINY